jgi:hypothetical protein
VRLRTSPRASKAQRPANPALRTREYLTQAEIERFIKAARGGHHGRHDATMILVAYRHGLRDTLANAGHDTRRVQDWLGHRSIQHTTRYTQLGAAPFKDFCRLSSGRAAMAAPMSTFWVLSGHCKSVMMSADPNATFRKCVFCRSSLRRVGMLGQSICRRRGRAAPHQEHSCLDVVHEFRKEFVHRG